MAPCASARGSKRRRLLQRLDHVKGVDPCGIHAVAVGVPQHVRRSSSDMLRQSIDIRPWNESVIHTNVPETWISRASTRCPIKLEQRTKTIYPKRLGATEVLWSDSVKAGMCCQKVVSFSGLQPPAAVRRNRSHWTVVPMAKPLPTREIWSCQSASPNQR